MKALPLNLTKSHIAYHKLSHSTLNVKYTNVIARATSHAVPSRRFSKHTISSLAQHTSATTYASAIGNMIIFKTVVAPAVAPHMLRWTSRRLSRWSVNSHATVSSVVASHVACVIGSRWCVLTLIVVRREFYSMYIKQENRK